MLELLSRVGFVPRRCTWEITLACNLRCGHCGSRAGRARDDELSTAEARQVIADLASLGCEHVTLAGGEPTLRADWPELISALRDHGVAASLISNGLTWEPALTARALAAGVHRIGFSLDGLERTHSCVRGGESYRRALRAVDLCVEAGVSVVAVTHVTRRSLPELEELHQLLGAHGVDTWQVQLGVPTGNLSEDREVVLGPADILELVPRLAALCVAGRRPELAVADNIGYYGEHEETLRNPGGRVPFWIGCRAGLEVLGLESHGDVKGCLSLPSLLNGRRDFVEGNVRQRSLCEIWRDPAAFAYNRKFQITDLRDGCAGCEWGEICRGGCTWTSVAHCGHAHAFPHCHHRLSRAAAHPAG